MSRLPIFTRYIDLFFTAKGKSIKKECCFCSYNPVKIKKIMSSFITKK